MHGKPIKSISRRSPVAHVGRRPNMDARRRLRSQVSKKKCREKPRGVVGRLDTYAHTNPLHTWELNPSPDHTHRGRRSHPMALLGPAARPESTTTPRPPHRCRRFFSRLPVAPALLLLLLVALLLLLEQASTAAAFVVGPSPRLLLLRHSTTTARPRPLNLMAATGTCVTNQ